MGYFLLCMMKELFLIAQGAWLFALGTVWCLVFTCPLRSITEGQWSQLQDAGDSWALWVIWIIWADNWSIRPNLKEAHSGFWQVTISKSGFEPDSQQGQNSHFGKLLCGGSSVFLTMAYAEQPTCCKDPAPYFTHHTDIVWHLQIQLAWSHQLAFECECFCSRTFCKRR